MALHRSGYRDSGEALSGSECNLRRAVSTGRECSVLLILTFLIVGTLMPAIGNFPNGGSPNGEPPARMADPSTVAVQDALPHLAGMKPTEPQGTAQLATAPSLDQSSIPPAMYDEQLGTTFTESFTGISYNVTATQQSDVNGYGPAYLLNGLSSAGYWYQVGLSFDWPYSTGGYNPGFGMNYEVFSPTGTSVFPTSGGGGLASMSVNPGDLVLLNLYFSGRNVVMLARDWNTSSTVSEAFNADRATSFIGLTGSVSNQNGFFTGLMTEWYHADAYYGNEEEVIYSDYNFDLSSGWMWMDEFDISNNHLLFSSETNGPVTYSSPNQLHQFSSNGASEAGDAYEFITGFQSPAALAAVGTSRPISADIGQSVTFTCNATGGLPPYSYSWTFGDGSASAGQIVSHDYGTVGVMDVVCSVTDNLQNTYLSPTSITIYSDPSVNVPAPSRTSVDVGQSVNLTTQAFGGSGRYTYAWLNIPGGCDSSDSHSILCDPSTAGTYQIEVNVTDSNGFSVLSDPLSFEAYSDPVITAFTVSPSSLDLGQESIIRVSVSGGFGALSYSYSGLPSGCAPADLAVLPCNSSETGVFYVNATVTDSNGFSSVSGPFPFSVNPTPTATVSASPSETDVGLITTLSVSATQGTGHFSYSYQGLPPGCSSSNTPELSCTPSSSGTYAVTVTTTDEAGGTATSSATVTVNSDPLITAFGPSSSKIDVGNETMLSVSVVGGTKPFSYRFSGLPPGCVSDNSSALSCTPMTGGNYTIQVDVTDYAGKTATASARLIVNPTRAGSVFPLEGFSLVVVTVVAVIAIAVATRLLLRRRVERAPSRIPPPMGIPHS